LCKDAIGAKSRVNKSVILVSKDGVIFLFVSKLGLNQILD